MAQFRDTPMDMSSMSFVDAARLYFIPLMICFSYVICIVGSATKALQIPCIIRSNQRISFFPDMFRTNSLQIFYVSELRFNFANICVFCRSAIK